MKRFLTKTNTGRIGNIRFICIHKKRLYLVDTKRKKENLFKIKNKNTTRKVEYPPVIKKIKIRQIQNNRWITLKRLQQVETAGQFRLRTSWVPIVNFLARRKDRVNNSKIGVKSQNPWIKVNNNNKSRSRTSWFAIDNFVIHPFRVTFQMFLSIFSEEKEFFSQRGIIGSCSSGWLQSLFLFGTVLSIY